MSGIDELKQNAENQATRIDISGSVIANNKSGITTANNVFPETTSGNGRHKVILPNTTPSIDKNDREAVEFDLTSDAEEKDDIHESMAKDILEGENSIFEKWKKEKVKEMNERLATFDQEKELADEEAEDEELEPVESDGEVVLGTESFAAEKHNATSVEENIDVEDEDEVKEIVTVVDNKASISEDLEEIINDDFTSDDDLEFSNVEVEKNEDSELATTVEEDDESQNQVDDDEVLKHLQKLATERLKPVAKSMNLSSFTILKKPTANIKTLEVDQVKAAKWVLPTQEGVVLMKEFLGSELEALREYSEDSNSVSSLYKKYRCVYDHIVSKKPSTYEAWLKATPYTDLDHYFFAIYMASFKGTNYIPLDCTNKKCGKTFITEDKPIMDMVKFENKEAREKFNKLNAAEDMSIGKGIYCSEIVPLSNTIAIAFKDASIYNLFEIASLDDKFSDRYSSIIEFIPYIDSLYIIDAENATLTPIGYKIYPDNATKSTKSKIKTFYNVLRNLSVDEFTPIKSFVRSVRERSSGISYVYPAVSCPYCGTVTEEMPTSAEAAVFLRYQLGALSNMSLK